MLHKLISFTVVFMIMQITVGKEKLFCQKRENRKHTFVGLML